ncbi:MAG: hypothetical protein WBE92_16010 [Steroidobacteraceae bacterium]
MVIAALRPTLIPLRVLMPALVIAVVMPMPVLVTIVVVNPGGHPGRRPDHDLGRLTITLTLAAPPGHRSGGVL